MFSWVSYYLGICGPQLLALQHEALLGDVEVTGE